MPSESVTSFLFAPLSVLPTFPGLFVLYDREPFLNPSMWVIAVISSFNPLVYGSFSKAGKYSVLIVSFNNTWLAVLSDYLCICHHPCNSFTFLDVTFLVNGG